MAHDHKQEKPQKHRPRPPHGKRPDGSLDGHPLVITRKVIQREPLEPVVVRFLTHIYGADWRTSLARPHVAKPTAAASAAKGAQS